MDYLVIPAYEPDYNLIRLIKKVREKSDFRVIVINDGSSASCKRVFEQAATYATVLHHSLNQGKGQALKTAFRYIQSQGHYGVIVTADADGQHKLWDILRVANAAHEQPQKFCYLSNKLALLFRIPRLAFVPSLAICFHLCSPLKANAMNMK